VCAPVGSWIVITGYDNDEQPLFGEIMDEGITKIGRIKGGWPSILVAPGEPIQKIDRKEADLEALKYAIALHREEVVGVKVKYSGKYPLRDVEKYSKYWRTGLKSFAAWLKCLRDTEHIGQYYYHSNILLHLYLGRSSAIRYLEVMQKRHSQAVADYLENAIQKYKAVIEVIRKIEWNNKIMSSFQGREALASQIENIVGLEGQAVVELEKTINIMN
jgi:hypothetical protein